MHWDWERIKEIARRCYEKAAALFLFENFVMYLIACLAAARPVGVHGYVTFIFHVFKWRG